jgi:hypothetical protein
MTQWLSSILAGLALTVCLASEVPADEISEARQAYLDGNYSAALKILLPAAEAGDANAQNIVGAAYENGNGVPQDATKALEWYEKSVAQGFAKAQLNLGTLLREGAKGVAQDHARAITLLEAAMAQNSPYAFWERGRMYRDGEGAAADLEAARVTFEQGLERGNGESGNALADLYRLGQGVETDEARARAIYSETAATGYAIAIGNLGYMFETGIGGEVNPVAAYALYLEAMARGDGNATVNLADFVLNTPGYWQSNPMAGAYCLLGLDLARDDQRARFETICADVNAVLSDADKAEAARIRAAW